MIDIYMTGARFHVDEPKAEMDAALLLDSILSGRTTTMEEGCIWPSMWKSTLSKGLILTLSGDTDLRITPTLNAEGLPELKISCCTNESLCDVYNEAEPCPQEAPEDLSDLFS